MEIKVLHQLMDWNEDVSAEVKSTLSSHHICMVNVMGSPGAGKTTLITSLINKLKKDYRAGVIEGDIAGQVDAERMARDGYDFFLSANGVWLTKEVPAEFLQRLPQDG